MLEGDTVETCETFTIVCVNFGEEQSPVPTIQGVNSAGNYLVDNPDINTSINGGLLDDTIVELGGASSILGMNGDDTIIMTKGKVNA